MDFNLNIYKADLLRSKISRFTDQIKNWKPLFERLGDEFSDIMREQFASEGAHASGGWKPLVKWYADWKEKNYPGRSILVQTGDMADSLISKSNRNSVREISETDMRIGTKDKKAVWHHFGSPKTKLPARPIIKFSREDNTRWVKKAHEWIVVQMRYTGIGRSAAI